MAIILQVSRHSWKTRLLVWFMYALLLAGSVTMIYPFWLMLAGAVSSEYDFNDFRLIPKYLFSDDALLGKTLYERYGRTNFTSLAARYGLMENYYGWSDLRGTEHLLDTLYGKEKELLRKSPDSAEKILADYWDFKKTLPPQEVDPLYPDKPAPFRNFLHEKYSRDASSEQEVIDRINAMPQPLALYFFTSDKAAAKEITSRCGFGGGCINDTIIHLATTEMGFGGFGESGMGAYHGKTGFDTFSHYKSIVDKKTWLDLPMRYQPYRKMHEKMVRFFLK